MPSKKENPSNKIARDKLTTALLALTREKSLSSISISELCTKAGVARMTFYRNYNTTEDILISHLAQLFDEYMLETTKTSPNGIFCDKEHLEHYFDFTYKHRAFLDGIIECGLDLIFLEMLNTYIINRWEPLCNKYTLIAFSGALYNMFHLWSSSQYTEKKDSLIEQLEKIFSNTSTIPNEHWHE